MKRIIFFALAIFVGLGAGAQVNLKIGSGAYLIARSAAQLVIDTGSVINNGTYMDSSGTLVASGGITVGGSGVTRLNNFTVSNTQHCVMNSLVSVYKTANLSSGFLDANNNLYIRSDVNSIANMVVAGVLTNNVKGIIARASATSGACPSYTSNLSLNISGPVVNYQWQSSPDSASWTNVAGATLSTYTATVTAIIYYRCYLTTTNSAYSEVTPGVKLLYGALPDAGSISGPSSVIVGSNISLTDPVAGGAWSASNGNATVSSGLVHGVTAGTVTLSYAVTNSCGSRSATKLVSVGSGTTTVTVSAITGYFFYLCTGATAPFFDATTGGSWSINTADAGVASVSATGIVSGISAGTARLSYTVGTSYAAAIVTVYPTPAGITGGSSVCAGSTIALTDATAGEVWSSTSTPTATISSAGVVAGVIPGTTTINYASAVGCKASLVVTVTTAPSGIGGASSVCVGAGISLSDFVAGGTWSSTAPVSVISTGSTTVMVTGLSAATAIVTYSLGASCYRTYNVTVKAIPTPILGSKAVCGAGTVTFLSDVTAGTSWTISPAGTATVSASGRMYGISVGTANVTYNASTGCFATAVVTVNALVTVPPISGATSVGHGLTITLSDATPGGAWSSSNSALGSVDLTGDVTGVGTSGAVTISYTLSYAGGGCSAYASKTVSIHTPAPHGHGTTATTDAATDGELPVTTAAQVIMRPVLFDVMLLPNPNKGMFTVRGAVGSGADEPVTREITDMQGQLVYKNSITVISGMVNEEVKLSNSLANGMYLLSISGGNERKVFHFVIAK